MKGGLVSIIIPVYNREHLIGDTLKSIQDQTYKNWECIVVDDGSTDATKTVVLHFCNNDSRITFYDRPTSSPKGANACRNYGFQLSKGEFVNYFDSDDIMHQQKLQLQVEGLLRSQFSFTVCKTEAFIETIKNKRDVHTNKIISQNVLEDFFTKKIVWLTQVPLFRKEFLKKNDFSFDESLQAGQDWELFTRILFKEPSYHTINKTLVYLRIHKHSISGRVSYKQKWNYFLARHKIQNDFEERFSPKMQKYLRFFYLKTCKDFVRMGHLKSAFYVWRTSILGDGLTSLKDHTFLICAFISFFIFKKGDVFLTKVK